MVAYPVRSWQGEDIIAEEECSGFDLLNTVEKDKLRRLVVADVDEEYGCIVPIEAFSRENLEELDESDLVRLWEEVEKLVERDRRQAGNACLKRRLQ